MAKKGGDNILAIGIGLNTDPLNAGFDEAAKSAKDGMAKVANEVAQSGAKVQESTTKAADKIQSLRAQFRQATQDAQMLAEGGEKTRAAFLAAAAKAGELKDQIGDINTVITAFSADSKFTVLAGAMQQAAGAASIVTGAMGLLGTESQATQEMLLKVQSALALTQGLAQIKEMGAAFTALQAVVVGQVIPSIMALGTATLIATGGLIVAITAATAAIISYNNSIDEETEAFKRANEEAKKNAEISKKIGDIVAETTSLRIAAMKDGFAKEKELLQANTNEQLRKQFDLYNSGAIAEYTYQQRIKYIKEAAFNELAKLDEKYAELQKKAQAKILPKPINVQGSIVNTIEQKQIGNIKAPEFIPITNTPVFDPLAKSAAAIKESALKARMAMIEAGVMLDDAWQKTSEMLKQQVQNSIGTVFGGIGQAIGSSLAAEINGENVDWFKNIGDSILISLADMAATVGQSLLATGAGLIIAGLPMGGTYLAAGAALMAASALTKGLIKGGASNGQGSASASGAYSGSSSMNNPSGQFKQIGSDLNNTIEIEGMVRGNNIELVNRRNMSKVNRSLIL